MNEDLEFNMKIYYDIIKDMKNSPENLEKISKEIERLKADRENLNNQKKRHERSKSDIEREIRSKEQLEKEMDLEDNGVRYQELKQQLESLPTEENIKEIDKSLKEINDKYKKLEEKILNKEAEKEEYEIYSNDFKKENLIAEITRVFSSKNKKIDDKKNEIIEENSKKINEKQEENKKKIEEFKQEKLKEAKKNVEDLKAKKEIFENKPQGQEVKAYIDMIDKKIREQGAGYSKEVEEFENKINAQQEKMEKQLGVEVKKRLEELDRIKSNNIKGANKLIVALQLGKFDELEEEMKTNIKAEENVKQEPKNNNVQTKTEEPKEVEEAKAEAEEPKEVKEEAKTEEPKEVEEEAKTEEPKEVEDEAKAEEPKEVKEEAKTEEPKEVEEETNPEVKTPIDVEPDLEEIKNKIENINAEKNKEKEAEQEDVYKDRKVSVYLEDGKLKYDYADASLEESSQKPFYKELKVKNIKNTIKELGYENSDLVEPYLIQFLNKQGEKEKIQHIFAPQLYRKKIKEQFVYDLEGAKDLKFSQRRALRKIAKTAQKLGIEVKNMEQVKWSFKNDFARAIKDGLLKTKNIVPMLKQRKELKAIESADAKNIEGSVYDNEAQNQFRNAIEVDREEYNKKLNERIEATNVVEEKTSINTAEAVKARLDSKDDEHEER